MSALEVLLAAGLQNILQEVFQPRWSAKKMAVLVYLTGS